MLANPGEIQTMLLGSIVNNNAIKFMIENKRVNSQREVKLLEITIDHKLLFHKHIDKEVLIY